MPQLRTFYVVYKSFTAQSGGDLIVQNLPFNPRTEEGINQLKNYILDKTDMPLDVVIESMIELAPSPVRREPVVEEVLDSTLQQVPAADPPKGD